MSNILARDIMRTDVKFAYEAWSIKYLASFLAENDISGAPVITSDEDLVGVVSVTDIFNFENQELAGKIAALRDYYQITYPNDIELLDLKEWSHNAEENCTVQQIMHNRLISVSPDTSIAEVCRVLLGNEIHRVFVTDNSKVVGVISTSNLLEILAEG